VTDAACLRGEGRRQEATRRPPRRAVTGRRLPADFDRRDTSEPRQWSAASRSTASAGPPFAVASDRVGASEEREVRGARQPVVELGIDTARSAISTDVVGRLAHDQATRNGTRAALGSSTAGSRSAGVERPPPTGRRQSAPAEHRPGGLPRRLPRGSGDGARSSSSFERFRASCSAACSGTACPAQRHCVHARSARRADRRRPPCTR